MLGMSTVGELNDHITNGDMTSFMLTQALQEQKIVEIVDEIKKKTAY